MCKITPEYFRKIFVQIYGTSPVKYISNLKLNRAKELLSSGIYTITDAAYNSGFNDSSYFSREFKKIQVSLPWTINLFKNYKIKQKYATIYILCAT